MLRYDSQPRCRRKTRYATRRAGKNVIFHQYSTAISTKQITLQIFPTIQQHSSSTNNVLQQMLKVREQKHGFCIDQVIFPTMRCWNTESLPETKCGCNSGRMRSFRTLIVA